MRNEVQQQDQTKRGEEAKKKKKKRAYEGKGECGGRRPATSTETKPRRNKQEGKRHGKETENQLRKKKRT
jgi:hypothetical protein